MNNLVLSLLVENNPGVVNRVTRHFTHRGYNIDSLNVGKTRNPNISKMTIVTHGDEKTFLQLERHLDKLIEVIEVSPLSSGEAIFRELALIKLEANEDNTDFIYNLNNEFNVKIMKVGKNTFVLEVIEEELKINELVDQLQSFNVLDVVRTGLTGMRI